MGEQVDAMTYLGIPMIVIAGALTLLFILNIIGSILDVKGKVWPEIVNFRGWRRRKKEEKEEVTKTLKEVKALLSEVNAHYSEDNITMRNDWMSNVDNRAITCGSQMSEMKETLLQVTQALNTNTKMTEDMFVESSRDRIIDFAEKAADYDILLSREQFRRIDRVYQEYESFLLERGRQNGEVDTAYEAIQDGYKHRLQQHSFLEDIKGYKIK